MNKTSPARGDGELLADGEVREIVEFERQGLTVSAISELVGYDWKTIRKYLREPDGVPEEILYDRMKTVWLEIDDRGEIVWHPVFLDFARYWGFTPRLCRPYRAQTKARWNRA